MLSDQGICDSQRLALYVPPLSPHLSMRLANGEQRVWVECEVEDWTTYNRPESQGGAWILAQRMKVVRELTMEEVRQILKSAT